jgi:hypothetical protein
VTVSSLCTPTHENPPSNVFELGTYQIVAPRLIDQGYHPIPVHEASKRPIPDNWNCEPDAATTARWIEAYPTAKTGLLLGYGLIAVDIDCYDSTEAERVKALAFNALGESPLVRRGKKGMVLLYRALGRISSTKRKLMDTAGQERHGPEGQAEQVEILATSARGTGSQVVAFGRHPETRLPYRWDHATPLDFPMDQIPEVDEKTVLDFLQLLVPIMEVQKASTATVRNEAQFEQIAAECSFVRRCRDDAATLSEPEWYAALSIIGHCERSSELVHQLSKPHPGYNAAECDAKLSHAVESARPRTCANIENSLGHTGCKTCPNRGLVRSPIVLGLPQTALARKYAYVAQQKRFYDLISGESLDKEALNDFYAHEIERAAALMLRSKLLTKVQALTFAPGELLICNEAGVEKLNLFRPSALQPLPGDPAIFLDHMEYLFPHREVREHVLDFLAFAVQRQGQKIAHALLLQGGQGIGKSYLGKTLAAMLGEHNTSFVENDVLHGRFNGWLAGKLLVVIEELMAPGRLELANKIKPWITQPTVQIEEKGRPVYETRNLANFIALTNHDEPIILSEDDRRFFVYRSPSSRRSEDYYNRLWAWSASHLGVILNSLLTRDLSSFNPAKAPPTTDAKTALILASKPPVERWLLEQIADAEPPFDRDLISFETIAYLLPRQRDVLVNGRRFGLAMKAAGAVRPTIEQVRISEGASARKVRPWILRNFEKWIGASEAELRNELQRKS